MTRCHKDSTCSANHQRVWITNITDRMREFDFSQQTSIVATPETSNWSEFWSLRCRVVMAMASVNNQICHPGGQPCQATSTELTYSITFESAHSYKSCRWDSSLLVLPKWDNLNYPRCTTNECGTSFLAVK